MLKADLEKELNELKARDKRLDDAEEEIRKGLTKVLGFGFKDKKFYSKGLLEVPKNDKFLSWGEIFFEIGKLSTDRNVVELQEKIVVLRKLTEKLEKDFSDEVKRNKPQNPIGGC